MKTEFHIVLVNPQIPPNTGNIGRICVGTNSKLHLIQPLGFKLDDRARKRAGLDYWDRLALEVHQDFAAFVDRYHSKKSRFFFTSTHAKKLYTSIKYRKGDFLIFGSETYGLPEEIKTEYNDRLLAIPHLKGIRSFNLANSVSIVLFEALRQNEFSFKLE
ncbi:tRNA (cytidine(34)-2'-O)-methyltransferase [Candidatus Riflebacteria bacterium]